MPDQHGCLCRVHCKHHMLLSLIAIITWVVNWKLFLRSIKRLWSLLLKCLLECLPNVERSILEVWGGQLLSSNSQHYFEFQYNTNVADPETKTEFLVDLVPGFLQSPSCQLTTENLKKNNHLEKDSIKDREGSTTYGTFCK